MDNSGRHIFPWWAFAIIGAGMLLASGIFLGLLSQEGFTWGRLLQVGLFALLGMVMYWAAIFGRK